MNIFFGKISKNFDIAQLKEGYYSAPQKSSWFGELKLGDYVYMIGGDKVQFWQAKKWGVKNERESLIFDVINPDLGINVSQLIALKYLRLTKALAVLTSRSARSKAFFKLDLLKDIPLTDLSNSQFYKNPELYRSINIVNLGDVIENSEDIQLTFENNKLELINNDFIDNSIKEQFLDNLDKRGKGAKMKDPVLDYFFKATTNLPATINYKEIGLRRFYDTFFCEYKDNEKYYIVGAFWKGHNPEDLTGTFLKESIWQNGFENELIDDVNKVPEGSNIAIKASYVRERTTSVMMIKARGIVRKNLQDGHILEVEWEEDFIPFEVPIGSYIRHTIKEVTNKDHIQAIWNGEVQANKDNNSLNNNNLSDMYIPKNQILYGPPGTGKTYNTINKALSIIESKTEDEINSEKRNILKIRFDDYIKNGQIVFTTFHQSMSYEDFIEGIKPKIIEDSKENKQVIYEIEDGIFKQIVQSAKKERTASKEIIEKYNFDDAWDDLYNESEKQIENKNSLTLTIQTPNLGLGVVEITERGNLKLKPIYSEAAKTYIVSYDRAKKLQEVFPDLSVIKNIDKEFRAVIGGSNSTAYWSVLNYINNKINQSSKIINTENEPKLLPHVLIIDEINRGNISQIFGELITLIEEDKRAEEDEKLEIILPYSKKKFSVPSNLYIIGTMNTADRSVEALDTALRRRFSFTEMMPQYTDLEKIEFNKFNLKEVLKTINKRIEILLDRDHTIGHSFFINIKSNNTEALENIFLNKIIPLLQEYFYHDYEKIALILGDGFIECVEPKNDSKIFARWTANNVTVPELVPQFILRKKIVNIEDAINSLLNK